MSQVPTIQGPRLKNPPMEMQDITEGPPFQSIASDVCGPFTRANGGNYFVLVIMCLFTRYVEMFCLSSVPAIVVADILYEKIVCRYGAPKTFLTDNGTNYRANIIRIMCRKMNINKKFTTPVNPKCNGKAESFMKKLNTGLFMTASNNPKNWDKWVSTICCGYNQTPHKATGHPPHTLMYGYDYPRPTDTIERMIPEPPLEIEQEGCLDSILERTQFLRNTARQNEDS